MNANATTGSLPAGSHYAITWGIPDSYAGMTNSMLHRSRAFIELTGAEVTIVTYEFREDYDVVRARLRERGALVDGLHLINLWEDLRSWDDSRLLAAKASFSLGAESTFAPLNDRGDQAHPLRNTLKNADGTILQVDYFREDGTLFGSDRRDVPGPKSRAFTLCDSQGQPIGTWDKIWDLYWFWLDSLPRDPIAWMIVDSKTSANHLVDYRRDDVVTLHVVHGSHLEQGTGRPHGTLTASRKRSLERIDKWDGIVFLTQHQLDDVEALMGKGPHRYVIPHGRHVPATAPDLDRSPLRGVMLSSLTERKRISHAIKAVARAGRARRRRPELDVFGQGPREELLTKLINRIGAPVRLRGYSTDADREFGTASFSLLTSSHEAFGLVLVESMAHGCIPISYDMPYGPADIITHGVDGYLVPSGDIKRMARAIRKVTRAKPAQLAAMREAAHRRALEFNDEHVTERWARTMNEVLATKQGSA